VTLEDEARERLRDVVRLQPTKNAELQERWGMESGSEVHQYLESELGEYYYRDENSLIRATPEAAELLGEAPGVEDDGAVLTVRVPPLQVAITEIAPGPDEEPASVVSVLHRLREAGHDPEVDEVRAGLKALRDKGAIEVIRKEVPTYRLAVDRETLSVEALEEA
jgi:hypothetical protein